MQPLSFLEKSAQSPSQIILPLGHLSLALRAIKALLLKCTGFSLEVRCYDWFQILEEELSKYRRGLSSWSVGWR